ncbi:hypothetical protein SAMN02745824_2128 [Parasphingorhabdus marina DSM 22363]|uniref:DUF1272 domain-containing protein n=1 Tax=Parasphingorhabdus marina DSM 22363 TaxID=1123272 RepID=A0A1N6EX32_9SPHN|nr:DUF1272 domain-containing protein [Parasphingorhabdus marina]SIN87544.1 hypothetical protein SAMN02745824_2128 [Parasphingorhabdus marina DSM 22363]
MLDMRPDCESCGRDLPADQSGALICSFECTFCTSCNEEKHHGTCPNCGGPLVSRPTRSTELLQKFPASTERKFRP